MATKKSLPAILHYSDQALWASCQTISSNLAAAYRVFYKNDCSFFSFSRKLTISEVQRVAGEIASSRPDRLIFIDDQFPHPRPILLALKAALGEKMPPIFIHMYGDFAVTSPQWHELTEALGGEKIRFICASPRHTEFVASFLGQGLRAVNTCPFPVNSADWYFDSELRDAERARLGLAVKDRLMIYSGRMTLQKNPIRLAEEFIAYLGAHGFPRTYLFFAGTVDDFGPPFLTHSVVPGRFFSLLRARTKHLPEKYRDRIRYLGHLPKDQLRALYNAADLFASVSTFHDDDFGLAPAEALSCGCPALLTDWGGYSGFKLKKDSPRFVPVEIDRTGLFLNRRKIQKQLRMGLQRRESNLRKVERGRLYRKHFSIAAVASRLRQIHSKPVPTFQGYTEKMTLLSERMRRRERAQEAFPEGMTRNSPYHQIYQEYME